MKSYLDLVRKVIDTGIRQSNRTGIDTLFLPGSMLQFDLRDGFPAVTTKRLAFKTALGELLGFLRGYSSAAQFRDLGCKIWDANANDPGSVIRNAWVGNPNRLGTDDLGRIYGVQWRGWRGRPMQQNVDPSEDPTALDVTDGQARPGYASSFSYTNVDQLANVLRALQEDPTSRRIIISAWRPDEFDSMALPPCHVLYQFITDVSKRELHLCMYQRSN